MRKCNIIVPTLFLALSCIGLGGCDALDAPKIEPVYNDAGQIQVQIDSERCEDNNYETVLKRLKQAGFKNFKINFEGDIIIGLLATEDDIDSIRINGVSNFDKDSYFDTKSVVFMDVHSKKADLKLITEAIDGQLPILYSTNSFKGNDKLYAGEQLTNVGFTHVAYNPIQDCYSSSDWDYNDAEGFTVNGNSSFYDYSFFDIDANIRISYHTVTGDYCTNGLEHTFKDSPAVEPTCTEPGWTAGTYCIVCNKAFSGHVEIPAKGHTKVIDIEATESTCVSEGHTEGSHCSTCGEVLSKSETIGINPDNHMHVDLTEAIEATCISAGRTEGAYCNDCHTVLSVSETIPIDSSNHKHTHTISGTPATCVSTGISDGLYCDDCQTIVLEQHETPIDPNNHTNIIIDAAVPATETSNGKSQGKHCGDCGAIIVKQETTYWYPDVSWMCSHNPTSAQVQKFVNHYSNQTISFNGFIYYATNYNGYSTIFNYYISGGNYVSSSQHNAIFYFEGLSQADRIIKDILGKGKGTNVSVTCKVKSVYNSTYVKCDLTSITCR